MRAERIQLGQYVVDLVKDSEFVFLTSYMGLTVAEFSEFRSTLVDLNAGCHVLKNTFIRRALVENEIAFPEEDNGLTGDTAIIFGNGDAAGVAKAIEKFAKQHDEVALKGGVLDGEFLTAADAKAVADLPPIEVLRSQLLGVLQAPSRNVVCVLNQKVATIAYVLAAYKNKLEENQA
jgi:large subunit ribosomal protein L10